MSTLRIHRKDLLPICGVQNNLSLCASKIQLNPKKLLLSKWTAMEARDKEKHFLVTKVINPEAPSHQIEEVEIEAVMSKRRFILRWKELKDGAKWAQGWHE